MNIYVYTYPHKHLFIEFFVCQSIDVSTYRSTDRSIDLSINIDIYLTNSFSRTYRYI